MSRASLPAPERQFRSRLAQLVHEHPFIHATLNPRATTCGKPGCHCARGEKHAALYLVCTVKGRRRQVFVPPSLEAEVRHWVENYHAIQDLLERVSQEAWCRLEARTGRKGASDL